MCAHHGELGMRDGPCLPRGLHLVLCHGLCTWQSWRVSFHLHLVAVRRGRAELLDEAVQLLVAREAESAQVVLCSLADAGVSNKLDCPERMRSQLPACHRTKRKKLLSLKVFALERCEPLDRKRRLEIKRKVTL